MSRFIAVDRDTAYLLRPSVDEWLLQDHLARFVVEVIDQLDLNELVRRYAGRGSAAYHPAMLVVALHVSQAPNDKREVAPILAKVEALPQVLGQVEVLLADTGYFSAANVNACEAQDIVPMLAVKRELHRIPVLRRFAADAPAPQTDDPVVKMVHRQATKAGRALYGLRKQTVEPVFGIIKRVMGWTQMSMRGLEKARGGQCPKKP